MTCESLSSLKLPETTITAAQSIPAGTYTAPDGQVFPNMPAFCRVAATLTPTSDSDIGIEVWMPASTWNGKFEGVGNGGFGGAISYSAMAPAVQLGYAATSTDTGHVGSSYDGSFALGHPQKIIDFGYRSIHLMTVRGKQISDAFYGENAQHSYFDGCSTGGRQALMEAQRFANDYDGIIAGDPVAYYTHHHVGGNLWVVRQMFNNPASTVFTTQDTLLGNAVNAACDALDGVVDGVLNDPRLCHYNPEKLLCQGSKKPPTCLTAEQVEAVKNIWTGPDQIVHQHDYYPPFERGGEADGWPFSISPEPPPAQQTDHHAEIGIPFFEYFVFDNPNWDFRTFNWISDPAYVENKVVVSGQTLASVLNSINPDLSQFQAHGGKLIQYHGFSDPEVPPLTSIDYFESVVNFPGRVNAVDAGVLPALHGAGNESLQRWSRRECVRHAHPAGAVGRGRRRAESNHRDALRQQRSNSRRPVYSSALFLSARGGLQGQRQYQRRCQLCLQIILYLILWIELEIW